MEADLLDFPELQDAQSQKKRLAESYTCSIRRARTPFQAGFQPRRNPCGSSNCILAQGAHSIEEYVTKLYEVFAPGRFVSSLVSNDLALGFLVVNAALVTFGL